MSEADRDKGYHCDSGNLCQLFHVLLKIYMKGNHNKKIVFWADRQYRPVFSIPWTREVEHMKQNLPVVRCIYTDAEKSLAQLLEESFRLYLIRVLGAARDFAAQNPR